MARALALASVLLAGGCHLVFGHQPGSAPADQQRSDRMERDAPASVERKPQADRVSTNDLAPDVLFSDDFSGPSISSAWSLWRMSFGLKNGTLAALPQARPGFAYGHSGNGRGAMAFVAIGNSSWRNYRFSARVEPLAVASTFNPHNIPDCFRGFSVLFRVERARESWNEAALTAYVLDIQTRDCTVDAGVAWSTKGLWSISRANDYYFKGTVGWGIQPSGASFAGIRSGTTAHAIDGANLVRVDVVGSTITFFLNGWEIDSFTDVPRVQDSVSYPPPAYGGVGFQTGWDALGTIDDVRVETLP